MFSDRIRLPLNPPQLAKTDPPTMYAPDDCVHSQYSVFDLSISAKKWSRYLNSVHSNIDLCSVVPHGMVHLIFSMIIQLFYKCIFIQPS